MSSFFQEATYRDLVFSRILCFFETSTWSHPFFQRYWVNSRFQLQPFIRWAALFLLLRSDCSHVFFQIYCVFAEQEFYQGDIIVTNYDTSRFLENTWSDPYVKNTVFILQRLLQPSIIPGDLWVIQKNLKVMFTWGKSF